LKQSVALLTAALTEHLAVFKLPQELWFHDEKLPRVATGKVFKRQLKQQYGMLVASEA